MCHDIDGALRVMMRRVYLEAEKDLGAVEGTLLLMGHEGVKKETLNHSWANVRERESVAKMIEDPSRKKSAERNASVLKKGLLFGINRVREGD